ncbi:CAP domain-containing protein [Haematococcus lacustris]
MERMRHQLLVLIVLVGPLLSKQCYALRLPSSRQDGAGVAELRQPYKPAVEAPGATHARVRQLLGSGSSPTARPPRAPGPPRPPPSTTPLASRTPPNLAPSTVTTTDSPLSFFPPGEQQLVPSPPPPSPSLDEPFEDSDIEPYFVFPGFLETNHPTLPTTLLLDPASPPPLNPPSFQPQPPTPPPPPPPTHPPSPVTHPPPSTSGRQPTPTAALPFESPSPPRPASTGRRSPPPLPPPPPTPTGQLSGSSPYLNISAVLNRHNYWRAQHGVVPLVWNNRLAQYAQDWADNCFFEHSQGSYGENLAIGPTLEMIDVMYEEICEYDYERPRFSEATGHFTQIVWAATRYLGCAIGSCSAGVTDAAGQQYNVDNYLVCEYWPPGNVFGAFPRNVPPLLSGARSVCTRRS